MLTGFISSMSLHLSRKRAADTFLELLTNSSSLIIVLLNELSAVFESVELPDPPEQIIVRYLETFPESSLANILAKEQQRKNLNIIAGDILSSFLDSKVNSCPLLRNFLCEILANVLFESTISSLSRPEVINGWIIHLLSKGEFEIMTAIDAGVETAQKQGVAAVIATNNLNNVNKSLSTMPDNAKTLRNAQQESSDTDMATEEAEVEAKRLSDMIAAHELQRQNPDKAINDNSRNETTSVDDALRRNSLPAGHPRCAVNIIKQSQTEVIRDQCEAEFKEASKLSKSPSAASTCLNDPNSKNTLPVSIAPSSSLTLYRASITVETDSELGGKGMFRLKPTSTYLLQVEPLSSRSTGWMVFRKYTDFESLHETLETISRLNKIRDFAKDHPALPSWKDQTKSDLAKNLERYLQAALLHESLAESERMRRFLGKDEQLGSGPTSSFGKSVFPLPRQSAFENLGKGVLGVLASAPKIVSGGKTVPEGMTGVFSGGISQTPLPESVLGHDAKSVDLPLHGNKSLNNNLKKESEGSARTRFIYQSGNHLSSIPGSLQPGDGCFAQSTESFSQENSLKKAGLKGEDFPGVIAENLAGEAKPSMHTASIPENKAPIDRLYIGDNEMGSSHEASKGQTSQSAGPNDLKNHKSPITQEETRLAVELIFAVINELYTLSSAWNIRRTLLNAAKSYILRPGNPNLETIRRLLQESMIDGHTSDEAVGMYLNKLRENIFPTETELKHWPPPSSNAEKEQLKETARKVFIKQGLPQALTSVMGTSASREALGKNS
ncbi:hypothetical protein BO70DRAFT_401480 [Aspergillus heteromorphus CBS 117.55]|uniref:PXA domain-containing protein n=1 Tax=Aspergillus heteromorphus CBS 117.55 TaxID=1448321 RepID=A0A317UTQ1_9EURO|nr:uncharacterized protein BO70DRAFT_401480 [Aspergillus heteromorphus CBS 117.55]PWY63907.1 hypothetical protein BO70DRAFT_401480 [Aspergillus heteromorphus CBS 117.55]